MSVVSIRHLRLGFITRLEPLIQELPQLGLKNRTCELVRENRRYTECNRRGDLFCGECLKRIDQRQVRVYRRLRYPVAAVRPATVVQHVWKVTVKSEYEVH